MFKAMGVKPGVSDLFLPVMRVFESEIGNGLVKHEVNGGLWIEMKAEGGRESEDQIKWLNMMRRGGYEARVCFGWEEAIEAIKEYLGGEWPSVEMGEMADRMMAGAGAGSAAGAK